MLMMIIMTMMETLIIIMMVMMEDSLETNYHDLAPNGISYPATDTTFDLCHSSKFGHKLAALVLAPNLVTRGRHLH